MHVAVKALLPSFLRRQEPKKPLNKSVTRDVYTYPSFLRRQERRVKALVFNDLFRVSLKP